VSYITKQEHLPKRLSSVDSGALPVDVIAIFIYNILNG